MNRKQRDENIEKLETQLAFAKVQKQNWSDTINDRLAEIAKLKEMPLDDEFKPGDVVQHKTKHCGLLYVVREISTYGERVRCTQLFGDYKYKEYPIDSMTKTDLTLTTIGPDQCVVDKAYLDKLEAESVRKTDRNQMFRL